MLFCKSMTENPISPRVKRNWRIGDTAYQLVHELNSTSTFHNSVSCSFFPHFESSDTAYIPYGINKNGCHPWNNVDPIITSSLATSTCSVVMFLVSRRHKMHCISAPKDKKQRCTNIVEMQRIKQPSVPLVTLHWLYWWINRDPCNILL